MHARTALHCDPLSVRLARRFVTESLSAERASPNLVDTAALLVSELVTNAVLHARSGIELSIACRRDWARVGVADDNPRGVVRRQHQLESTTGRGLMLVGQLASTWGVEPSAAGKQVWFEVQEQGFGSASERPR